MFTVFCVGDLAELGKKIRDGREALGLTQTEFAVKAGVSLSYIQKLEAGSSHKPRFGPLRAVALAIGADPLEWKRVYLTESGNGEEEDRHDPFAQLQSELKAEAAERGITVAALIEEIQRKRRAKPSVMYDRKAAKKQP